MKRTIGYRVVVKDGDVTTMWTAMCGSRLVGAGKRGPKTFLTRIGAYLAACDLDARWASSLAGKSVCVVRVVRHVRPEGS